MVSLSAAGANSVLLVVWVNVICNLAVEFLVHDSI